MRTFRLLTDHDFNFRKKGLPSVRERAEALVTWIESQTEYQFEVHSSDFRYLSTDYSHYLVTIETADEKAFAGHGRAEDPYLAFLKGFSEAVERLVMSRYFHRFPNGGGFLQRELKSSWDLTAAEFNVNYPPNKRMHNSNGWAVHSDLSEAFKRAFMEAIERHSMQFNYWNHGLGFLKPLKTLKVDNYTVDLSVNEAGFGQLKTITAAFKKPGISGQLFGHSTVSSVNQDVFIHPQIEAYQIAESLRLNSQDDGPENIFDQIQRSFWFGKIASNQSESMSALPVLDRLNLNIVAIDIQDFLGLPFELYACWTYSDSIMPLFLEASLSFEDKIMFADQYRYIAGHEKTLFQTPFI